MKPKSWFLRRVLPTSKRRRAVLSAAALLSQSLIAGGQTLYWDMNGAEPGFGSGSGSWDAGTNWTTSPDGELPTIPWTDGSIARIQNAGDYTLSIGGVISTPQIRFTAPNLQTIAEGEIEIPAGGLLIHSAAAPSGGGHTKTISSLISGTGALSFAAHGDMSPTGGGGNTQLTLSNTANTFTGPVTITSGLVSYLSNGSFGNAANPIILNGGGLLDPNRSIPLARNIEVQAAGGVIRTWGSVNTTWTGTLTGSGNLRRTDGGTLGLNMDASAFTGTLTNDRGTLRLDTTDWSQTNVVQTDGGNVLRIETPGTTTIKSLVSDRDVVVAFGSRLNIANGTYTTVGAGTDFNGFWAQGTTAGFAAATGELTSSSGTLTITNGALAEPRGLTTTDNRIRLILSDFNGSTPLAVVKNHDNQLVLDMANTHTGGTTINGGRIHADNLTSFGSGTVTVNDFGQAWLTQPGTYANNFVINGLGVPEGAGRLGAIRFTNTSVSGNIHVASDARMVAWGSVATLSGALTGSANLDLNLGGSPGTINFTGSTSGFTGTMSLNAGTLNVGALGGGLAVLGGTANVGGAVAGAASVAAGSTLNLNAGAATTGIQFPSGGSRTLNLSTGSTVTGDIITDVGEGNSAEVNIGGTVNGNVVIDDGSVLGSRGGTITGTLTTGFDETSNIAWNHLAPLTVGGQVTLNGTQTVTLAANPTPGSPATILNYSGTLNGSVAQFVLTNPDSYRSAVITDTGTAIQINTGSAARTWTGTDATNPSFWDNASNNWAEGDQRFFNGDAVLFDDTATGTTVAMQSLLSPFSVTFNNTTQNFTVSGGGGTGITGSTGLVKNGSGTITLGGVGSNFTGPVAVNAGILNLANGEALGFNSGISVAAGARVNLNGHAPSNQGRHYTWTIAGDGGDGPGGVGAITTTGGDVFQNGSVLHLVLAADAEIGGNNGRFDIARSGGITGSLNGNGHTLTKVGTNAIVARGPATNVTFVVNGGRFTFEDFDSASGTNPITVNNTGRLSTWGNRTIANNVTVNSGATLASESGNGAWTGTLDILSGATVDTPAQLFVRGTANQTGTVAKNGGAQLTITGTWDLGSGVLNQTAGTIQVGDINPDAKFTGNGTVNVGPGLLFRNRLAGGNNTIDASFTFASPTSELRQHTALVNDTLTLTGTIGNNITDGILRTTFGQINLAAGANASVSMVAMQGAPSTRSVINVASGASLTSPYFNIGQNGSNSGILNVTGGTVTVPAGGVGVRIGHWNNNNAGLSSQINVTAGLFDASVTNVITNVGWDGFGTMSVGGGASPATYRAWRLQMDANGDSTPYNMTASVLGNGTLEIGAGGTASPSTNDFIILNGGRMIATGAADWGARIEVAGDSEIGSIAGIGASQTGPLTGSGNLAVVGGGAFRFASFGSWTGDLTVAEGTLVGSGVIPGNTTVAVGGTLSPGASHAVGSLATVALGMADDTVTLAGTLAMDLNATDESAGDGVNDLIIIPDGTTLQLQPGTLVRPNFFGGTLASGNRYRLIQVDGLRNGPLPTIDPAIASTVRFTFNVLPGVAPFDSDVELVVSGTTGNLIWSGDGAANAWDINATSNWTLDGDPAKFLNYDSVSFTDAGNAATPIVLTGNLFPTSVTVDSAKNYTWQGTGGINGSAGLTKGGSGTLTINNVNALNGPISIGEGSVILGPTGGIATTGGDVTIASGASAVLDRSDSITINRTITGGGSLIKNGPGTVNINTGGNDVLPASLTVNDGTLQVSSGSFFTGSRLEGSGLVTINAGGTLLLQGAAHALGGSNAGVGGLEIAINGGTMTVNNEQYAETVNLNGGLVNGSNEIRAINGSATTFNVTGTSPSTYAARLSLGFGNAVWNVQDVTSSAAADAIITGPITGANGLVKNGLGTLALNGTLAFTGTLVANEGVVSIAGVGTRALPNQLGGAGIIRNDATGALSLTGTSPAFAGTLDTNGRSLNIIGDFGGANSVIRIAGTPLNAGVGGLSFASVGGDVTSDVPVTTTTVTGDFTTLHSASGTVVPGDTTHVFRGRVLLQGGTQYSFAKNFDDHMWVSIGSTVVIDNDVWNAVATGTFTPPATDWYDIDIRAYQGGGGVGPQGDWQAAGIGLGIRIGAPTLVPGDYQPFGNGAAGIQLAPDANPDTIAAGILLDGGASATIYNPAAGLTISGAITSVANEGIVKTGTATLNLTGVNTYTGNTNVTEGTVALGAGGQLRFRPTTANTSNKVTGAGAATFSGTFNIDLSSASAADGNSWVLVDVASRSYTATFSVAGFADPDSDGIWERSEAGNLWSFNQATGILSVSSGGGAYDTWASSFGLTGADADRNADPDGDGFTNLQEFLFGSSPVAPNGSLSTLSTSGGQLVMRWLQRESGVTYSLTESTMLGSWTGSTVIPTVDTDQSGVGTGYDRWRAVIPLGTGKKFYRVEAAEN